MTTFKQFVQESATTISSTKEFIELVKRDCDEFIVKSSPDHQLYRGINGLPDMGSKTVRTDRRPTDTSGSTHQTLNDFFEKDFGFKYRSGALFVNPDVRESKRYGQSYHIFPVDGYTLMGSKNVDDLYTEVSDEGGRAFFRPNVALAYLTHEDAITYKRMIDDTRDFKNEDIDALNYKIFKAMQYFESKNLYEYGNSEIMIKVPRYYFLKVENKGWNGSDDIVDAIYK